MFQFHRITPRTCLWPLVWTLCATFALSVGLTYSSNHHCYASVCGEWLFPLQARLHVVVWYMWLSFSTTMLTLRAFQPSIRNFLSRPLGRVIIPVLGKRLRLGGLLLALWVCTLYGVIIGIWWKRLSEYFEQRGEGLPGNSLVAAVALTGHLADVTMGMILLPVSRHSALASFLKLAPLTTYAFHMTQAYVLLSLVLIHGLIYAAWTAAYNQHRALFRPTFPVLNPTYLYNEVWPGDTSSLGVWRASLIFSGIVSSSIMFAMFFTSFPVIRRKYFNLFYFTHLLGIVAVVIICLHASTMFYCTMPGLSLWLLDWGMRIFELRGKIKARLHALGNGWYTLTLPLPRDRLTGCACHSPLAHFYIHHSQSSIFEIHPFTTTTHLASQKSILSNTSKASIEIQFLFRQSVPRQLPPPPTTPQSLKGGANLALTQTKSSSRQWTNRLAMLADAEEVNPAAAAVGGGNDASTLEKQQQQQQQQKLETLQPVELEITEKAEISRSTTGVETYLRLEGPYFNSANPERYRTVVCLVAGTGLSGALAIAAAFKASRRTTRGVATCYPTTSGNDAGGAGREKEGGSCDVGAQLQPADDSVVVPPCLIPQGDATSEAHWQRCVVVWSVRANDYVDMPFFSDLACEGLEFRIHKTGGGGGSSKRLDVRGTLAEVCGSSSSSGGGGGNDDQKKDGSTNATDGGTDGSDVWTYISGPNGFVSAAAQACCEVKGLTWFVAQ